MFALFAICASYVILAISAILETFAMFTTIALFEISAIFLVLACTMATSTIFSKYATHSLDSSIVNSGFAILQANRKDQDLYCNNQRMNSTKSQDLS